MPLPDTSKLPLATMGEVQEKVGARPMRVDGVGRMADNPKCVLLGLSQTASDNDLRSLHEFLRLWPKVMQSGDGVMVRARRLVEEHIATFGMVPHPDLLKDTIAAELGFVQLASIPHRDDVADLRKLLTAASHALKSYAYGNAAPDLAIGIAEKIDAAIGKTGGGNG